MTSVELAVPLLSDAPSLKGKTGVATANFFQVCHAPSVAAVWDKPAKSRKGLVCWSVDGGHSIAWSGDGTTLFWPLRESSFRLTGSMPC